jgi:hypothetical protein
MGRESFLKSSDPAIRWAATVALVLVANVVTGCSASGPRTGADGNASGGDVTAPVDDAGDAMPAPVRIIRGDPTTTGWLTLTIEGHGLTALEGRLVSIRIGSPDHPLERLGSGEARVENGAFSITFPNVWEPGGTYKQKLVFVDTDGDSACTGADQTYLEYRASQVDIILTLPDSVPPAPRDLQLYPGTGPTEACPLWNMPWPDA